MHNCHVIKLKRMHDDVQLPTQSEGDVGFDLRASGDIVLNSMTVTKVSTGLQLADDPGTFWLQPDLTKVDNHYDTVSVPLRSLLKIEGRSGLASRGIWPVGGIVDPSYRGELGVMLYNSTQTDVKISKGDRIAQLVWYPVLATHHEYTFQLINDVNDVKLTQRGENGFGSTGR